MVKGLFRYVLIASVLVLIFGVGTNAFCATLADAYGVLIGNGWSGKDALGFLGTSIAGTIAMNPSLAPAVAAGALAAYIGVKGGQLYDIYQEWKNLRTGIAMLNPVEVSQSLNVVKVRNGEHRWSFLQVTVSYAGNNQWYWRFEYIERYNSNGYLGWGFCNSDTGTLIRDNVIECWNYWLQNVVPRYKDAQGKAMFTAHVNAAYNNMIAGNNYSVMYSRNVVAALEGGSTGVNASTLGYHVDVDPGSISEDGVQYLNDPDAFYQWFVTNYMNGTNEGTFVTPTHEAYNEIRTQLENIITQLNNLSSTGGVSEEVLNQVKTDIINTINSKVGGLESTLTSLSNSVNTLETDVTGVKTSIDALDATLTSLSNSVNTLQSDIDTKFDSVDSGITGVNTSLNALESDIESVKTSIDSVIEAQQEEKGFWDGLMEWLDVTLWQKLREVLQELFLPTQEQLDGLLDIEVPEYEKQFATEVSFTSQSASMPITLFGTTVDLSEYIDDYASGLRGFMNIFVCGIAAIFVIRAFRVRLNID